MIDHRVGDLAMLKLLFHFLSLLFFSDGNRSVFKGLSRRVGDLGMLVALLPPPFVFGVCGSLVCVRVRYYMCGCV